MKTYLHVVLLSLVLWLSGCASTDAPRTTWTQGDSATEPSGQTSYLANGLKPLSSTKLGSQRVLTLLPPADIWDRIRRGFAIPDLDSDLVRERELWYSSRPEYMNRMTERGRKYLFYIVEELERRNMPSELALLPFVESAFNPQAVSSAKAAGMWQFMPATGRDFDLKQNIFRDDRRDVIESTRAALDYLQRLHKMFGDWHLALAAYNWGEGSVQRAIKKAVKAGASTAYADLAMPMETRFYVPKLQAIKNIVADPRAFRVKLADIGNHPFFQSVDIKNDIDVALAARLAEITLEDFRALNPSVHKPVLLAAGNPQILLPWDNAERFQSNLEAYGNGRLANWTVWIAPSTLRPADAARQVGMAESELRAINQIPPRMLIKAGSALLVRRSAGFDSDATEHHADNGYLALAPEIVLKKTLVKAGKKDTPDSVAQRFGVSVASLLEWNKLGSSARLKAGQSLTLYLPPSRAVAARAAARPGKVLAKNSASGRKTATAGKPVASKSPLNSRKAVRLTRQ